MPDILNVRMERMRETAEEDQVDESSEWLDSGRLVLELLVCPSLAEVW